MRRWLDRRLGGAGPGREFVLAAVRERIAATYGLADFPHPIDFGASLIPDRELGSATVWLSERGGADRLRRVGWWGATICALTLRGDPAEPGRAAILGAAARFNVAVALFDSVVDSHRRDLPPLADALRPDRLRMALRAPDRPLACDVPLQLVPVVGLFDSSIRAAGRSWRDRPDHLTLLGDLLERMYLSELGLSCDGYAAKELPVVFLGAIGSAASSDLALHRTLGRFVARWDDWLDQADDLLHWRVNAFFGDPLGARGLGSLAFAGRAAIRVARGSRALPGVAGSLVDALSDVLTAARRAAPVTELRTGRLLEQLVR